MASAFHRDVADLTTRLGQPIHAVFFSGDLTQRGSKEEFSALDSLLEKMWTIFAKVNSHPILVCVPGNHDLQRPGKAVAAARALAHWSIDEVVRETFWNSADSDYRQVIQDAFGEYERWVRQCPFVPQELSRGLLPGDCSIQVDVGGTKFGVVGLNSAFLQLGAGDYKGRLSLDVQQLLGVVNDPDEWLASCSAAFLMTHHPPDWLEKQSQETLETDILCKDRFVAHLFGHMHTPSARTLRLDGGVPRRALQAASLFGLEEFGEHGSQQPRIHGYTLGSLSVGPNPKLRLWPRLATKKGPGYYSLASNPAFDTDADGAFEESVTLPSPVAQSFAVAAGPRPQAAEALVERYRRRLASNYERWDLGPIGVAQPGGSSRPVSANLDDMYVPLRFAKGYRAHAPSRGAYLAATNIGESKAPIAVRGPAGAGKTTWLRRTFRELLRSPTTLPVMIVLRDVARRWNSPACAGPDRCVEALVTSVFHEHGCGLSEEDLQRLLEGGTPRVILLVDGWDEIGPLAEEMRSKLVGFLRQYPKTLAVVTSRPYGESQPSDSEGFHVLDIQPLSNSDISKLTGRFYEHCFGDDPEPATTRQESFLRALRRTPESLRLARTPLLLTMMLFISRSRPMPDKRHKLYQDCVDNLLTALPDSKEEAGALNPRTNWRPDDGEERLRVVAFLAAALFERRAGSGPEGTSEIVATIDELEELLPDHWPQEAQPGFSKRSMRLGFVYWLSGSAGLLSERTDGTFAFTHLSFQEYLTAWHLHATVEGEARVAAFLQRVPSPRWTEVLRLWAAILGGQNQNRAGAVIDAIADSGEEGMLLAGLMYADGIGSSEAFERWASTLARKLAELSVPGTIAMLHGWRASQQASRRGQLVAELERAIKASSSPDWLYLALAASPLTKDVHPAADSVAKLLSDTLRSEKPMTRESVGVGRVLAAHDPLWPGLQHDIGYLSLWPSRRRILGYRLQLAAAFGATREQLVSLAEAALLQPEDTVSTESERELLGTEWAKHPLVGALPYPIRYMAVRSGTALHRCLVWAGGDLGRERLIEQAAPLAWFEPGNELVAESVLVSNDAIDWNRHTGIADVAESIDLGFRTVRWGSFVPAAGLAAYSGAVRMGKSPVGRLFEEACKVALDPDRSRDAFEYLASAYPPGQDILWISLARHVTGTSTQSDREALLEAASSPHLREGALGFALAFIVRGDLVLADGTELTLDEITDILGRERLPLLEEFPRTPGGSQFAEDEGADLWSSDEEEEDDEVVLGSGLFGPDLDLDLFSDDPFLTLWDLDNLRSTEQTKERAERLKPAVLAATNRRAISWYVKGRHADAARVFRECFEAGVPEAGNNLAYMLRRKEVAFSDSLPPIAEILSHDLARGLGTAYANMALALAAGIDGVVDWRAADNWMRRLRSVGKSDRTAVVNWWQGLAAHGEGEGHLVLAWCVRHGYADDPDGYSVKERMNSARAAGWNIPAWLDSLDAGWSS